LTSGPPFSLSLPPQFNSMTWPALKLFLSASAFPFHPHICHVLKTFSSTFNFGILHILQNTQMSLCQ
jgi:hypothetical protein